MKNICIIVLVYVLLNMPLSNGMIVTPVHTGAKKNRPPKKDPSLYDNALIIANSGVGLYCAYQAGKALTAGNIAKPLEQACAAFIHVSAACVIMHPHKSGHEGYGLLNIAGFLKSFCTFCPSCDSGAQDIAIPLAIMALRVANSYWMMSHCWSEKKDDCSDA